MIPQRPLFDGNGMRIGTQMGNGIYGATGMRMGDLYGNRMILYDQGLQPRIGRDLSIYGDRLDPLSTHKYLFDKDRF